MFIQIHLTNNITGTEYIKFVNFVRRLFSRIALKDIFATLKIRDNGVIYLYE